MKEDVYLDLRGLEPPEPMARVLDALAALEQGQAVRMLIDREPRPLYRILERNGYRFHARALTGWDYGILIRQGSDAAPPVV